MRVSNVPLLSSQSSVYMFQTLDPHQSRWAQSQLTGFVIITRRDNFSDEAFRRIGTTSSVMQRLSRICSQRNLTLAINLPSGDGITVWLRDMDSTTLWWTIFIHGANINWTDFFSNDEVLSQSGFESLSATIQHLRVGLSGHITRMLKTVLAASVLYYDCPLEFVVTGTDHVTDHHLRPVCTSSSKTVTYVHLMP